MKIRIHAGLLVSRARPRSSAGELALFRNFFALLPVFPSFSEINIDINYLRRGDYLPFTDGLEALKFMQSVVV